MSFKGFQKSLTRVSRAPHLVAVLGFQLVSGVRKNDILRATE
jgi:hypothetical protein